MCWGGGVTDGVETISSSLKEENNFDEDLEANNQLSVVHFLSLLSSMAISLLDGLFDNISFLSLFSSVTISVLAV